MLCHLRPDLILKITRVQCCRQQEIPTQNHISRIHDFATSLIRWGRLQSMVVASLFSDRSPALPLSKSIEELDIPLHRPLLLARRIMTEAVFLIDRALPQDLLKNKRLNPIHRDCNIFPIFQSLIRILHKADPGSKLAMSTPCFKRLKPTRQYNFEVINWHQDTVSLTTSLSSRIQPIGFWGRPFNTSQRIKISQRQVSRRTPKSCTQERRLRVRSRAAMKM